MHGINSFSLIPVRSQPSEKSEMVTQLLFGEIFEILDKHEGWALIVCKFDNYEGWIDEKLLHLVSDEYIHQLADDPLYIVGNMLAKAINLQNNLPVFLPKGSVLPFFHENTIRIEDNHYSFEGDAVMVPVVPDKTRIEQSALSYINVPYFWGGRNPLGMDCSGFVQMVFRSCGYKVPRDAAQQSKLGESVDFIYESQPGDLAFFDNPSGDIIHVGILLGENEIIHASGNVHIDHIDHHGIFRMQAGKYTHQLRIIKRIG
jgi:gamma-D-glutamyl-L-lysine dipeptidyl-peptidase